MISLALIKMSTTIGHVFFIRKSCRFQEAQLGVLAECELLEHAVNAIRASCTAGPGVPPSSSSSSQANGGGFRLPTTPLVVGSGSSNTSSGHSVEQPTRATAPLLDPAIATGSAALSFAATQLPLSSQLSIASTTTTTTTGVGGLFGCSGVTDSVTTLHSQPPPPPPAPPAPTGLGSVVAIGSPGVCKILVCPLVAPIVAILLTVVSCSHAGVTVTGLLTDTSAAHGLKNRSAYHPVRPNCADYIDYSSRGSRKIHREYYY